MNHFIFVLFYFIGRRCETELCSTFSHFLKCDASKKTKKWNVFFVLFWEKRNYLTSIACLALFSSRAYLVKAIEVIKSWRKDQRRTGRKERELWHKQQYQLPSVYSILHWPRKYIYCVRLYTTEFSFWFTQLINGHNLLLWMLCVLLFVFFPNFLFWLISN